MSVCSVEGCGRTKRALGYCPMHYRRHKNGIPFDVPFRKHAPKYCAVSECNEKVKGGGYCNTHWRRVKVHGHPQSDIPIRHKHETGEWYQVKGRRTGYVLMGHATGNGLVFKMQHRIIMEQMLGRELLPGENVHHLNGVRDDNRPENLELWVTMQPTGQRPEDLVVYAREILKRYA